MKIVFCTTCKGRVQHIKKTLPQNLADNPTASFVVLDYNSQDGLLEYLAREHTGDIIDGRLAVYSYRDAGAFRMSHAKNMAHRLAILEGADVLVNMDADNYAAPGFDLFIRDQMENSNTFLFCNAKSVVGRARQGLAGRIVVSRQMFMKTGGYDERYLVWAPEDEDFKSRLRRLGAVGKIIGNEFLYVIPHKDGLRFKEYPDAKPTPETEAAALKKIRESTDTIANWGDFGCGQVYRIFGEQAVPLNPVPTRVFGIGMHKTATTSLHHALKILGFDSAHWTGPWWAKRVWEEMQVGRSLTVEQHYAMCDLPFTLLYRELDKAYPGSKFILTLRDERAWVESVRTHWQVNSHRYGWDQDCFTHRCHHLLYGRKSFDAETMVARFRRHNAEVREYFKDRPADLLTTTPGWNDLCSFLGCPAPNVPYPFEFQTNTL